MAKFDHERAHMAAKLVSDPPVSSASRRSSEELMNPSKIRAKDAPFTG